MSPIPGSRLVRLVASLAVALGAAPALQVASAAAAPAPEEASEPARDLPSGEADQETGAVPAAAERFLLVAADRQSVDVQLGKLIAEGNVQARFDGWLLLADRVEVLESTRSVYASGRIRLSRGDQTLQAGRLRYSELEGSGELEDVYGVIDQERLESQITSGAASESHPEESTAIPFACPELVADPAQRPVLELLPPGRLPLPTLPPPAGCPGADASSRPRSLRELLTEAAHGPLPGAPADGAADTALDGSWLDDEPVMASGGEPINQRVGAVRYRQSVDTAIRFDLFAPREEDDPDSRSGSPTGPSVLRRPRPETGRLNRLRFQASTVRVNGNRWTAREIAFTNDPFTPARSWLIGTGVEALLEEDGVTRITARRTRILLNNRVALRGINNTTIGEEGPQLSISADRRDRDGLYVGYNLPSLRLGDRGRLDLQPQFMVQRAFEGSTDSYTRPGGNLAGSRVRQDIRPGDLFGLVGVLDAPVDRFRLRALADLSTLDPDNFRAGTRSKASLTTPLSLPGHDGAQAGAFGSYRERISNGSLGRQTLITSYGAGLEGQLSFNRQNETAGESSQPTPHLAPLRLDWSAIAGSYRAELFNTDNLDTQWRTQLNASLSSSLRLWQAPLDPERHELPALRYSAVPIRPGLALDFGVVGSGALYQDGARQNTLTLYGGPALTLGRFREPWFDYTQLSVLVGATLRDGLSPFGFDRAVDLRTVSFRAAQQLYGPLVLEGGATVNIDRGSRFSGDVSSSYVELKLMQRSYEVGIFYSPDDGTAGLRVTLNDFSFSGSGTPFVPSPGSGAGAGFSESR